jgi:hypothetical protein
VEWDFVCIYTLRFRTALFWAITQPVVVIPYRPRGCPETSVRNDYTLRNCPEECSSRLRPGGSMKSRKHTDVQFNCQYDEALPCVSVPYSVTILFNVAVSLTTL